MLKKHLTSVHALHVENPPCVAVWFCHGTDLVYGVPSAAGADA